MPEKILVPTEHDGERLDIFITKFLGTVSRSAIQKAIKNGQITINERPAKPHTALRVGDMVTWSKIEPTSIRPKQPKPEKIKLNIMYEDEDLLVVDKPSGMLVHPTVLNESHTLVAALLAHAPKISKIGYGHPERPGIMQRLDKEASGLMVIAKNDMAFNHLKRQFQKHTVDKRYLILVHGRPPEDEGVIDLVIGRATNKRRMAARSKPLPEDRVAKTHYHVIEYFRQATLVEARTETGRTHQIRVHFRALGCPVAGDKLYGHKRDQLGVGRLFLHAETLGFIHPRTNEKIEFHSPLPDELKNIVQILKNA
jgi:23S rRNA pseudouridine1911/1915/1917 synthase